MPRRDDAIRLIHAKIAGYADIVTDPSEDVEDEVISIDEARSPKKTRDQDGVSSLRDVEAEQDEEEGITDTFTVDDRAAREIGADLDGRDEP